MVGKLGNVQKQKLIDEVRRFPYIYNPRHESHRDKNAMKNSWKTISENMAVDETLCRKTWDSLKDYYHYILRVMRKPKRKGAEDDSEKPPRWRFFDRMSFMEPYYATKQRPGYITAKLEPNSPSDEGASVSNYSRDSDQKSSSSDSTPSRSPSPDSPPPKTRRPSSQVTDQRILETLQELGSRSKQTSDEWDVFGAFVASSVKNLPTRLAQLQLKRQINSLISNAELEALNDSTAASDRPTPLPVPYQ